MRHDWTVAATVAADAVRYDSGEWLLTLADGTVVHVKVPAVNAAMVDRFLSQWVRDSTRLDVLLDLGKPVAVEGPDGVILAVR